MSPHINNIIIIWTLTNNVINAVVNTNTIKMRIHINIIINMNIKIIINNPASGRELRAGPVFAPLAGGMVAQGNINMCVSKYIIMINIISNIISYTHKFNNCISIRICICFSTINVIHNINIIIMF